MASKQWKPLTISIHDESALVDAIRTAGSGDGILLIKDIGNNQFLDTVRSMFDRIMKFENKEKIERLNKAYSRNLVLKDSTKTTQKVQVSEKVETKIDQKRTLDLSPNRIAMINRNDPSLLKGIGSELESNMSFFEKMTASLVPKVLSAFYSASGIGSVDGVNYNYRMVDYFTMTTTTGVEGVQSDAVDAPRCGEHRDFGLFTLIFQDQVGGLQIEREDGKWYDVPSVKDSVVLLFGWCAQIASNDRIKATKHRVIPKPQRRNSAVLFVAPEPEQELVPVVQGDEKCHYGMIKVDELKARMRNAWQKREGTLSDEKKAAIADIKSQCDVLEAVTL